MIAAALLAAPAGASAAETDAVCAVALMAAAQRSKEQPGVSAELRDSLTQSAHFYSGVLVGRYDDGRLSDVMAEAVADYAAPQERSEVVIRCIDRHKEARERLRAANQRAGEKLRASRKNPKPR